MMDIDRRGKGLRRIYVRETRNGSHQLLKPFFQNHIVPKALIKTNEWNSCPLKAEFPHVEHIPSCKKGAEFPGMHRVIMIFKARLRSTYHSVEYLWNYFDDYCYRFKHYLMKGKLFDKLSLAEW